jgi:hypothetical protein
VPGFSDYSKHRNKFMKREANKKVRNSKHVPDGSGYKKLFCSYDICDFKFLFFNDEELGWWYEDKKYRGYMK